MAKARKSAAATLRELTAEMAKPVRRCRFPDSRVVPDDVSLFTVLRISEIHGNKMFGAHVCRDNPRKPVPCLSAS